jgi:hypothetical protein
MFSALLRRCSSAVVEFVKEIETYDAFQKHVMDAARPVIL